jgi:hypothetical protein
MDAATGPRGSDEGAGTSGSGATASPRRDRSGRPDTLRNPARPRQGMTRNVKRVNTLMSPRGSTERKDAPGVLDSVRQEFTFVAEVSGGATSKLESVTRRFHSIICRYSTHDWFALAYPPARRWECLRCGVIVEEAAAAAPARRPVPRVGTKQADRPTRG